MDERTQLLTSWEMQVQQTIDAWPRPVQAIAYRHLYFSGFRFESTQQVIDDGLKEILRNGRR